MIARNSRSSQGEKSLDQDVLSQGQILQREESINDEIMNGGNCQNCNMPIINGFQNNQNDPVYCKKCLQFNRSPNSFLALSNPEDEEIEELDREQQCSILDYTNVSPFMMDDVGGRGILQI
jgi:late competence protein required for DNA uptake (superfamily II DNA/RNA helicase)